MMRRAVSGVLAAALFAVAASATAAPRIAHWEVDADKGELKLWVDIRKGDDFIRTVEPGKLTVKIDDKPIASKADIKSFAENGDGYNIVFIVDASDSWSRNWDEIREAYKGFVSRMRKGKNKVAMVMLRGGKPEPAVSFTTEIHEISETLDKTTETEGIDPKLFDAIRLAIKTHADESGNWRRIIVMGTDFEDESAMDPTKFAGEFTDLYKELDKSEVEISLIFMTTKILPDGAPDVDEKVITRAKKLADKTNGFFRRLKGLTAVAAAYKEIAEDIDSMPVITIKPDAWPKAGPHLVGLVYAEMDSKEVEVEFPPPATAPPECEINADCAKGQECDKAAGKCVEAEVKEAPKAAPPPDKSIFEEWWFWLLVGLGGLGVVILIIALIAGRSKVPDAPEAPVASGAGCMECGQPNKPGPRCMEGCVNRARGKLVITSGNMSGKILYILDEITTFGKAPGNNYIVFDDAVSSKHFGVKIEDARFELADFGSTNGTFVNGTKASKQYLKVGDVIRVGHTEMTFQLK